jgi:predicted RNA-binding protein YlqC (UPF0109 family)
MLTGKQQAEEQAESILTRLCAGLCAYNADLNVVKLRESNTVTFYTIVTHPADFPRVCGKGGSRYKILRFICRAIGARCGHKINLERMPKTPLSKERFQAMDYKENWPRNEIKRLLVDTCAMVFTWPVVIEVEDIVPGRKALLLVSHDESENPLLVGEFKEMLRNLFEAIGMANGCWLEVDLKPDARLCVRRECSLS